MRQERLYREVRRAFEDFVLPEFRAARGVHSIESETLTRDTPPVSIGEMSVYDQIKQALQDLIAPQLRAIQAEQQQTRVEMASMKAEVFAEIRRLDARVDSIDRELRTAIDIRERLAALEARHRD